MSKEKLHTFHMSEKYIKELLNDIMLLNRGNKIDELKKKNPPYGRYIDVFYKDLMKYKVEKGI